MKANLVGDGRKPARYVTKYIAKDMLGRRIHASQRYGLSPVLADLRSALRGVEDVSGRETLSHYLNQKVKGVEVSHYG